MKLINPNSREYEIMCINFKTYNTILKRSIHASKQHYFASTFAKYKSDMRNTWKTINEIISRKNNKKCFPKSFNINNKETTNTLEIANACNMFFTNICTNLVNNITYSGDKNVKHYLKENLNCKFTLNNVDKLIVQKTIDNLLSKNSTGIDSISTTLLKQIAPKIIKSLTLFLNKVFSTGIFPEKLKVAKVIPLFKKADPTITNNYRPISLLAAMSKIFEKIMGNQLSSYFESKKL